MYVLERFGAVLLPTYGVTKTTGTDGSASALVMLPGGTVYDALGTDQAVGVPEEITLRGIVDGATAAALQTTFDALRAYRGKKQKLYARMADASVRWRWARLGEIRCERKPGQVNWLELEMPFIPDPGGWYGAHYGGWYIGEPGIWLGDGHAIGEVEPFLLAGGSGVPNTPTILNGGNASVRNLVLTITAGPTKIDAIHVTQTIGVDWTYSAEVAATKALVINCGAKSVVNDGTDDYAHFALHSTNHTIPEWLRIDSPSSVVTITLTGGGVASTAHFDYSEPWE